MARGGKRKGAGRKPGRKPHQDFLLRLDPIEHERLKKAAKAKGLSLNSYITYLLAMGYQV